MLNSITCTCGKMSGNRKATTCNKNDGFYDDSYRRSSRYCFKRAGICFDTPTCLNTNGSAPNTRTCRCGSGYTTCDIEETNHYGGPYCYQNQCHQAEQAPQCAMTDGEHPNTVDCYCGSTYCGTKQKYIRFRGPRKPGPYCYNGECRQAAKCTVVDGSAPNPAPCYCGTSYCGNNNSSLLCFGHNVDGCGPGFHEISSGTCDTEILHKIEQQRVCKVGYKLAKGDWIRPRGVTEGSNWPGGCSIVPAYSENGLYFTSISTSNLQGSYKECGRAYQSYNFDDARNIRNKTTNCLCFAGNKCKNEDEDLPTAGCVCDKRISGQSLLFNAQTSLLAQPASICTEQTGEICWSDDILVNYNGLGRPWTRVAPSRIFAPPCGPKKCKYTDMTNVNNESCVCQVPGVHNVICDAGQYCDAQRSSKTKVKLDVWSDMTDKERVALKAIRSGTNIQTKTTRISW
jgi:hypothetical protein